MDFQLIYFIRKRCVGVFLLSKNSFFLVKITFTLSTTSLRCTVNLCMYAARYLYVSMLVLVSCLSVLCELLVSVRIHSVERYSGMVDEGIIINAIGVACIAILAVVMYILSRNKFRTPESRGQHIRASVDL